MSSKTTNKIAIDLPALSACLPFASTDNTRAYLVGIYIHWKGLATAYVSTDGHKLCLAETDKAEGVAEVLGTVFAEHEGVILPSADVKELARWANFDPNVPAHLIDAQMFAILEIDGQNLTFTSYDGKLIKKCKAIDGAYPDYQRVIPKEDTKVFVDGPVGFNSKYLADIMKAAKAGFSHAKTLSCRGFFYGIVNASMFKMTSPENDRATIVIMPMRV